MNHDDFLTDDEFNRQVKSMFGCVGCVVVLMWVVILACFILLAVGLGKMVFS